MAVLLIVEDGSGVQDANSYLALSEVQQMAENIGLAISANEDEVKANLIKAAVYLETNACKFQGKLKTLEQGLSFPRTGVYLQGIALPDSAIPRNLKAAQFSVFKAISQGFEPNKTLDVTATIIKDKVDVLETTFANPADFGSESVILTEADKLLAPLYNGCNGAALRSFRA